MISPPISETKEEKKLRKEREKELKKTEKEELKKRGLFPTTSLPATGGSERIKPTHERKALFQEGEFSQSAGNITNHSPNSSHSNYPPSPKERDRDNNNYSSGGSIGSSGSNKSSNSNSGRPSSPRTITESQTVSKASNSQALEALKDDAESKHIRSRSVSTK